MKEQGLKFIYDYALLTDMHWGGECVRERKREIGRERERERKHKYGDLLNWWIDYVIYSDYPQNTIFFTYMYERTVSSFR